MSHTRVDTSDSGAASAGASSADGGRKAGSSEDAADRVCRLAARLVDASAALLSLTDGDHPYLVGRHGVTPGAWWSTSPMCAALAEQEDVLGPALRVDDMSRHDLLGADPIHDTAGMAAVLAVPLQLPGTYTGSLAVLDRTPRHWSDDEVEDLRGVASVAAAEMVLRLRVGQDASALRASWRSFVELVDGIDAVVNERDPGSGRIIFVSGRAQDIFGYPVKRWTSEPRFWEDVIVHPDDRERVLRELRAGFAGDEPVEATYRALTDAGRTVWVQELIRPVREDGRLRHVRGVMVDVTRRKAVERELERKNEALLLLQDLAVRANESRTTDDPFHFALHRVCEHAGWPVGHVQEVVEGPDGQLELAPSGLWYPDDPTVHPGFRAATARARFRRHEGLPGRVLASGLPEWIASIEEDGNFPRAEAARRAGLTAGFAFPVLAGREVAAVFELFTPDAAGPDVGLMELTAHVGAILGRVVERQRSEKDRSAAEQRTRDILETAHDAFVSMDTDGRIREWNRAAEGIFGWSRDEVLGRTLADVIIPEDMRDLHREGLERFMATGEGPLLGQRVEVPALCRDGGTLPVELTISPLRSGESWMFNAFLHDIGERKHSEEERRRREELLAETQRLARIGSWDWDVASDRIAWSDELHRLFGTDPERFDPTLEGYLRRLPEEDRERAEDVIGRAMGTGQPFAFEHRIQRADGTTLWVLGQGRPVVDDKGEIVRMVGTAQDITGRREAEAQERQLAMEQAARAEAEIAEDRVRTILESISDAFFAIDESWRLAFLNPATEALLGEPASRLVGRPLMEVFPDTPDGVFGAHYEVVMRERRPVEFEAYYPALDAWYEARAFPNEEGMSVYLHDITDRRRAEERLRASESRYRFLADSIPQQIWTATPTGELDYVNQVVADFFGVGPEALVAEGWQDRIHPDDQATVDARWAEAVEKKAPYEVELRLRSADGRYRWHLSRALPQRDEEGRVVKWYGTNTYVHDQKEAEAERDRAVEELERVTHLLSSERTNLEAQARELRRTARALKKSNEELDRFAYITSHDLKAPLRGIANLATWLAEDLEKHLDEGTREYIELLQGRVHRMEGLIDGILQYSRAGRSQGEVEEVDVGELVREVVDLIAPPPHFDIELGPWWPVVRTERTPLHQVFLNLVSNAVKHADGDAPLLKIDVSDEGEGWYEFSVADNGPGIAPEFHDKVFTIFQTLKPRDQVESTGIGLSVVKRIVEQNGGQVWIESREGEGATFKFLWPMSPKVKEDERWTT